MNKERFHNALAFSLGYERLLNEKRYVISIDENKDVPIVLIRDSDGYPFLSFKASETEEILLSTKEKGKVNEIRYVLDKVLQAYIQAILNLF